MIKKLILAFLTLATAIPLGLGAVDESREKALEILKNRLASVEDRLNAIEKLKSLKASQIAPDLIKIIRDSEDSMIIRGHAVELLIATKDSWTETGLKTLLNDPSLPSETKRMTLYGLWKRDPEAFMPELIHMAQNQKEAIDLRAAAISYLGQTQGKYPPEFWRNLFSKKSSPIPIRIAAMNAMETLQILNEERMIFTQVLQDSEEPIELRKSVILTSERILSSTEFEADMMDIISKPENPLEIRLFALDNLAAYARETSLSQLRQILSREKNRVVANKLESLIINLTSKRS